MRSLKKNLETVPVKHSIDSLQKTAILGTSHIIRKVLQCEAWSLSGGDHRWFKKTTRKKCLWQETYISYNNNYMESIARWSLKPGWWGSTLVQERYQEEKACDKRHPYCIIITIIIPNNKPGIVIRDNKQGTCMLIDDAIPGDRHMIKKEAGKILKYRDLIIGIQCMWNMKAKVIPVITRAIGTISKSIRQYLSHIPGKHESEELQKQPYWALHTYYGKCKFKSKKKNIIHGRNNITCSTNCKYHA